MRQRSEGDAIGRAEPEEAEAVASGRKCCIRKDRREKT